MNDAQRWEQLRDRVVQGESLAPADASWVEQMAEADPAYAAELALFEQLDRWDAPSSGPSQAERAIVAAALAVADGEDANGLEVAPASAKRSNALLWVLPVLGIAAAALLVVIALGGDDEPAHAEPEVLVAQGQVFVDGRALAEAPGSLTYGATIAVTDGVACFGIGAAIDVCLAGGTTARLDEAAPDQVVEVLRGHAVARLRPLADGRSFSLAHREVKATAVGTVFSLDVDADAGLVSAAVLQGTVAVAAGMERRDLSAHEVAIVSGANVEWSTVGPDQEALDLALVSRVRDLGPESGSVIIDCTPAAGVTMDGVDLGLTPIVLKVAAGSHRLEVASDRATAIRETVTVEPGSMVRRGFELPKPTAEPAPEVPRVETVVETPELELDPEPKPEPEVVRPESVRPTKPAHRLLAEARRARQAGQWKAAAATYMELVEAHPRSAEARTSLVSLGDIQLDRLRKARAAARSYGRYLSRGGGPLAQEARFGRIRAFRAMGERGREAKAIRAFLRHHPASARARELRARLPSLEP